MIFFSSLLNNEVINAVVLGQHFVLYYLCPRNIQLQTLKIHTIFFKKIPMLVLRSTDFLFCFYMIYRNKDFVSV